MRWKTSAGLPRYWPSDLQNDLEPTITQRHLFRFGRMASHRRDCSKDSQLFRYLAFVWNASHPNECQSARRLLIRAREAECDWVTVTEGPGLTVLVSGVTQRSCKIYHLHNETGVVLGTLFEKHDVGSREAPTRLAAEVTARILQTGGRELIERHWGRYVAFFRDSARTTVYALRDPSAGLPCFWTPLESVHVYFSWIEDAVQLGLRGSINWPYVAAALCYFFLRARETGIEAAYELIGGECIQHQGDRRTPTQLWNPLDFAAMEPIEDLVIAKKELRHRVRDSVHVWVAPHESVVHLLSGGVDSSIVASCLASAPSAPRVTCLNHRFSNRTSDEREYARICAGQFNFPLIERVQDDKADLQPLRAVHRSATPDHYLFSIEERAQAQIVLELGATAVISGWGGDQLFYQNMGNATAAEYLRRHGLATGWLKVALDAARLNKTSLWKVLGQTARQLLTSRHWCVSDEAGRFKGLVPKSVIAEVAGDERFLHPWFKDMPRGVPAEKAWHAYALSNPFPFYSPFIRPGDPEHLEPLYTQPLIELVLRIAAYVLTARGWDRALARRAFQEDLPREIVTRTGKGTQDAYWRALLGRNLHFVREMLLDGELVARGLLNRKAIETALSGKPSTVEAYIAEIFGCLSIEIWLQRWSSR